MKKLLWIIAGISLVAGAFLSCTKKDSAPAASAQAQAVQAEAPLVSDLGSFTMQMVDNFQYSDGYQGKLDRFDLMKGKALAAGETYNLKMKFTTSRDMENDFFLGFADTTEAANWWKWLSMEGDGSDDQYIPNSNVKAGQEVSVNLTLRILYDPTSSLPGANALIFETRGDGSPGTPGSGVQGAFDVNFTEFVLSKN